MGGREWRRLLRVHRPCRRRGRPSCTAAKLPLCSAWWRPGSDPNELSMKQAPITRAAIAWHPPPPGVGELIHERQNRPSDRRARSRKVHTDKATHAVTAASRHGHSIEGPSRRGQRCGIPATAANSETPRVCACRPIRLSCTGAWPLTWQSKPWIVFLNSLREPDDDRHLST